VINPATRKGRGAEHRESGQKGDDSDERVLSGYTHVRRDVNGRVVALALRG